MSFVCVICFNQLTGTSIALEDEDDDRDSHHDMDVIVTKCGHLFHRKCLGGWLLMKKPNGYCPSCKDRIGYRNFQRVFPPDSGEDFELMYDQEREINNELRNRLAVCEERIMAQNKKSEEDASAMTDLRSEFDVQTGEFLRLENTFTQFLGLHQRSECLQREPWEARPPQILGETEVIEIANNEAIKNFSPTTLTAGMGFCIQARDWKTGVQTFVNVMIADDCVEDGNHTFENFNGPMKIFDVGKFHAGHFAGAPASLANLTVGTDMFSYRCVTPEIVQQFFAQVVCKQLNDKGGLHLDYLHIKIMTNLHIVPVSEGKENHQVTKKKRHAKSKAKYPVKKPTAVIKAYQGEDPECIDITTD